MRDSMLEIVVDPTADAAYVTVSSEDIHETKQLSPELLVDLDQNGRMVGFELLRMQDASRPLSTLYEHDLLSPDLGHLLEALHPFGPSSRFGLSLGHDGQSSRAADLVPA